MNMSPTAQGYNNIENNNTAALSSFSPDPKLVHLVQKLLVTNYNNNTKRPSTKQIFELLLSRHREYKRKNSTELYQSIDQILNIIATPSISSVLSQNSTITSSLSKVQIVNQNSYNNNKNKRKRKQHQDIDNDDKEQGDTEFSEQYSDEEYDEQALIHDNNRSSLLNSQLYGGSTMLNAGLRNRYKDIQRERDAVAKQQLLKEEESKEKDVLSKHINDDDKSDTDQLKSTSISETISATPTNVTGILDTPNKSLLKKRKKKDIKSSSSLSNRFDESSGSSKFMISPSPRPKERYSDLGGMSNILTQIRELVEYPLSHPELFTHLGIHPPRGVLLRGPPGCGKTHLANSIAGQLNVTYFRISAPEIVSGMSGESESRLRDLFQAASDNAPAILFMDELDAIAPKRGGDGGKGMEKRIVAQLLTCMDSLTPDNTRGGYPVMVLGATNRPDSMDEALRRAGRFDREICLGVPDENAREGILRVMTKEMRLSGDLNFKILARKTPGFVGADIRSLTKEAGVISINRIFKRLLMNASSDDSINCHQTENNDSTDSNMYSALKEDDDDDLMHSSALDINSVVPFTADQLEPLYVTMEDFLEAVSHVQPSSKREGFATVPDVSWDNVGALESIREELTLSVLEPISHPEKFQELGLPLPAGVLLYGPPGCGKTLLAKAIAHESGANFISVKGPELLDKYVGESERAVRVVFERARSSSPCIVFFDELDSLCPKRGSDSSSGGGGVSERVVNQLLTEMDGLDSRRSVFVIAATNRPELIDPAMLRPGRLDKLLYVPLPSAEDRHAILLALATKVKLSSDVDLKVIAHSPRAEGYSGADCAALLREAGLAVLRECSSIKTTKKSCENESSIEPTHKPFVLQITSSHFDYAFDHVMPSVSKKDQARYDKIRDRMARARSRGGVSIENQGGEDMNDTQVNVSPDKALSDVDKTDDKCISN